MAAAAAAARHCAWWRALLVPRPGAQQQRAVAARAASQQVQAVQQRQQPHQQQQQQPQAQQQAQQRQPRRAAHQTLDYTALAACCHELAADWVPSKVEEVVQPDRYTLALRLRTPLTQGWLYLSWHPTAARVCVGRPPLRGDVAEAFTLAQQVAAHIKGLVLVAAQLPAPWERVVQLDFGRRPGEAPSRRLYCEIMAKYSNVVLTDADGSILQCAFQVGGAMSSLRQLQQGRPYVLPPRVSGIAPDPAEPLASWQDNVTRAAALAASSRARTQQQQQQRGREQPPQQPSPGLLPPPPPPQRQQQQQLAEAGSQLGATLLAGLTRAYMGASPSLAEELCLAAGLPPDAEPAALQPAAWASLHAAWCGWLERLTAAQFVPCSCPTTGRISLLGTYTGGSSGSGSGNGSANGSSGSSGVDSGPQASAHALIDGYYFSLQAGELYAALHARLSTAVRGALKKARGRVRSFEQQLQAAADAAVVQRQGDIIVANLYRIPDGASELQAEDWDTGEQLTLALDPLQPPMAQAEALFKRARKLRRAVDAVAPLLAAAQEELAYLESVELELSQMPPGGTELELPALREVQEELIEAKVIKPPPEAALSAKAAAKGRKAQKRAAKAAPGSAAAAAAAAAGGVGLRAFTSPGGFTVLVGRNNKQNDVLSHQVAKPGDVWMHVRGLPGSHTVLRIAPGQGQPDAPDLQFAADLAAWFSKARDAGKVDVVVARAEHLKKPRGGKPGQVLVSKEETNIVARPAASAAATAEREQG